MDWIDGFFVLGAIAMYTWLGSFLARLRRLHTANSTSEQRYAKLIIRSTVPLSLLVIHWSGLVGGAIGYFILKFGVEDPAYDGVVPWVIVIPMGILLVVRIRARGKMTHARKFNFSVCPRCEYVLAPQIKETLCSECGEPICLTSIRKTWQFLEEKAHIFA